MLVQDHLISIRSLTRDDILFLLKTAEELRTNPQPELLKGKLLASCFYEPSTRTRLSFEAAMLRLGGQVITVAEPKTEALSDGLRVIGSYADILVIRHPLEGSAQLASEVCSIPVINAGDGANQHPTQTLTDLFAMQQCFGQLEGLEVAFVGDLRYGRTVHSLARACALFDQRLYLISPPRLEMPEPLLNELRRSGLRSSGHESVEEIIEKVDLLYCTRLQRERMGSDPIDGYQINPDVLTSAKPSMRIFHPMPRADELPMSVDTSPHAYYFEQAAGGVFVRQALLAHLLGAL